jgi:hypothetical protein
MRGPFGSFLLTKGDRGLGCREDHYSPAGAAIRKFRRGTPPVAQKMDRRPPLTNRGRRIRALLIAMICTFSWSTARCAAEEAATANIVERGLKISPVEVNLQGRDRNTVGWGSYLVNAVADCNGCHTFPQFLVGGDPFLSTRRVSIAPARNVHHFLAGGFCVGRVISSNITPNRDGRLPSNMTLQQFIAAMRSGHGNSPSVLRIMPWPAYQNMTEHDLDAIYQYLSAIPHAEPCNLSCPPSYPNSPGCPNPAPPR